MPTAYTAGIGGGQSFEEFVLTVARGMGACVMQRDDPMAEPPKLTTVSEFETQRLATAFDELGKLLAMTPEEREQMVTDRNREAVESHEQRCDERKALLESYLKMRARAADWVPPTAEHAGLKEFMLEQIDKSADFDCWDPPSPKLVTVEQMLTEACEEVTRAKKALEEERERVKSRNEWIVKLYESLGMTPPEVSQ